MALQKIRTENLSARVYATIRSALINGQYAPGQRLRISALAEELGTSITPVREAIFRLVSERALEMTAATAVHVPFLTCEQLSEIRLIRMQLEGLAAERAATMIDHKAVAALEIIQRDFIKAAATDPKMASLLNRDFHFAILKHAQMPQLEVIVENMWTLMGPLLGVFHATMPVRQIAGDEHRHYKILAAIRARDGVAARTAMEEDIDWGRVLEAWLQQHR